MCAPNDVQRHRRKQTHSLLADRVIFIAERRTTNERKIAGFYMYIGFCIGTHYERINERRYERTAEATTASAAAKAIAILRDWRISWNPTSNVQRITRQTICIYLYVYILIIPSCRGLCSEGRRLKWWWSFILHSLFFSFSCRLCDNRWIISSYCHLCTTNTNTIESYSFSSSIINRGAEIR